MKNMNTEANPNEASNNRESEWDELKKVQFSGNKTSNISNCLPRTPAVEPVTYADGSKVHLEPTDLSLKSEEKPPIILTGEDISTQSSEQSRESDLPELKKKVKDIMTSTFESRINKQISLKNPDLYEKISSIKDSLYYDSEENKPSEEKIQSILTDALPFLEQYSDIYEETKKQMNNETRKNRLQKSEEKKIYNLLHKEENNRLKKRRSLYTAYDLSDSKSIPDEYMGLNFEEVQQAEQEKQLAQQGYNLFDAEENSISQPENENNESVTNSFYEDLNILKNEPRYPEAVEIYTMMDWQSFPNNIEAKIVEEAESSEGLKQSIEQIKSFGKYAEENPPDSYGARDIGVDDRLILGDKYNSLISDFRKVTKLREITLAQSKGFCHELASIIHDYEEDKKIWRIIGEKSLGEALDAYADIKGADITIKDLGAEVPKQVDRYTIMPLVTKINDIVRQDWQQKITPIDSYQEGAGYNFICSRVKEPFVAQENKNSIFSGSLLTDSYRKTIGDDGNFGFILPPDHIIAAAPHDIYTHNWSDNDKTSLRTGVPVIMSYDRVLRESQQDKTYSEITTRDLPVGIFYIKDNLSEENRKKLEDLAKLNPELPIIAL